MAPHRGGLVRRTLSSSPPPRYGPLPGQQRTAWGHVMRNKILALLAIGFTLAGTLFLTTASQASTTSVDLSITGSTVAGYTKAQHGQELPVVFTIRNRST